MLWLPTIYKFRNIPCNIHIRVLLWLQNTFSILSCSIVNNRIRIEILAMKSNKCLFDKIIYRKENRSFWNRLNLLRINSFAFSRTKSEKPHKIKKSPKFRQSRCVPLKSDAVHATLKPCSREEAIEPVRCNSYNVSTKKNAKLGQTYIYYVFELSQQSKPTTFTDYFYEILKHYRTLRLFAMLR